MLFRELLAVNPISCEVWHNEVDEDFPSIEDLSLETFTPLGLERFAKVLDATITIHNHDTYGMVLEFSNVGDKALSNFTKSLAGYCSETDFDKWFII